MAFSFWPSQADNVDASEVLESRWSYMSQFWTPTGVIKGAYNEFETYADSTGMQVKIKSGRTSVLGFWANSDTEEVKAIEAADPANPRIDTVIVKMDRSSGELEMTLEVKKGAPAASPVALTLSATSTLYEFPLADVYVGAGVVTITAGDITDRRVFSLNMSDRKFGLSIGIGSMESDADVLTTGLKFVLEVPANIEIDYWKIRANASGNVVLDIKSMDYGGSNDVSICASAKPTLSSAQWGQDSILTGWTTEILAGKLLAIYVDSASTITGLSLMLGGKVVG
jgi:hypothetical protein